MSRTQNHPFKDFTEVAEQFLTWSARPGWKSSQASRPNEDKDMKEGDQGQVQGQKEGGQVQVHGQEEHGQGEVCERYMQVHVDDGVIILNSACVGDGQLQCDVRERVVHYEVDDWCGVVNDNGKNETYVKSVENMSVAEVS